MTPEKLNKFWLLIASALVLIIIITGLIIWFNKDRGELLTLIQPKNPQYSSSIYVDGNVNYPGIYAFNPSDSLDDLINRAGGLLENTSVETVYLCLGNIEVSGESQKVNINRAEKWLLTAIPGIGEVKAQAIIDYRKTEGGFHSVEQITEVPGITQSVYKKIKDYITVE